MATIGLERGSLINGEKLRVYRNLHTLNYSCQGKDLGDKGWRVKAHRNRLLLHDATFKVSEAGRERVLREKKKNVHAFIVGEYRGNPMAAIDDLCAFTSIKPISYNPYAGGFFFDKTTGQEVVSAGVVWVLPQGVWADRITYGPRRKEV